jgi:hypothetical protein
MGKESLYEVLVKTNMRIPEGSIISPPFNQSMTILQSIIEEVSGERSRNHFRNLKMMGGFAPSPQYREIANYIKNEVKSYGLEKVGIKSFPSDGELFHGVLSLNLVGMPVMVRYGS